MLLIPQLTLPAAHVHSAAAEAPSVKLARKFQESMKAAQSASESKAAGGAYQDLVAMRNRILKGEIIPPQELIVYQIRAGEFNLRVELVSKVAESIMTTFRKFQNSQ